MVKKKNIIILNIILFSSIGFGQNPSPDRTIKTDTRGISPSTEDSQVRQKIDPNLIFFNDYHHDSKLKQVREKELTRLNGDISPLLAPADYSAKFSNALKNKKVKLARIYPEKNCYNGKSISVEEVERCAGIPPIIGGGSFYSFRLQTNLNERIAVASRVLTKADWADIHFIDGKLVAGSSTVQGIIAETGNVDFESLDNDSEAVKFLKDYKSEDKISKLESQKEAVRNGIQFSGYNYSDSVSARLNSTYVLRSIAYLSYSPSQKYSLDEIMMLKRIVDPLDIRTDVLIAFKIIGIENDGSLIILWKELKRRTPPVLKY